MTEHSYMLKYDEFGNTREIYVYTSGSSLHGNSFVNKGTAFTFEERTRLGLTAMLPPSTRSLRQQVENSRIKVNNKKTDLERFMYIRSLFDRNVTLAHALIKSDISRYMPIIYTPTVGLACQQFSSMFRSANGLHFYPDNIDRAEDVLRRFLSRDIRVAVVSEKEALARIFTLDSGGLITTDREVFPYKQKFAHDPAILDWIKDEQDVHLERVIKKAGVTVLIGTSGQQGAFNREVVTAVLRNSDRPVIMPLSNPTDRAEAVPSDIYAWTKGRALVGTGSPFSDVVFDGINHRIGQSNNVFIFPGIGLGVLASGAREVLPEFFTAAAKAVSEFVTRKEMEQGTLLPPVAALSEVSLKVAQAVGETAIRLGVSRPCAFSNFQHQDAPDRLEELIMKMRWNPVYLPLME